jgi:hypothetical protein
MDFSFHSGDIQRREFAAIGLLKPNRQIAPQILYLLFFEIFTLGEPAKKLPAFSRVEPAQGVLDLSNPIHGLNIPMIPSAPQYF